MPVILGAKFDTWMNDDNTFLACCSDGIKPVVFKLERIAEQPDRSRQAGGRRFSIAYDMELLWLAGSFI